MKELITRLESAKEHQQYSLIREAVALVHTHARCGLLIRAIDFAEEHHLPELLLGVALTLMPEGWFTYKVQQAVYHPFKWLWNLQVFGTSKQAEGVALIPSIALTIAALKAQGEMEGTE